MRVLGIDPGLTRCGLGVVEGSVGRPLRHGRRRRRAHPGRRPRPRSGCCAIERGIEAWLDRHRPDAVAVERVFSQHNVRTVMGTAQASGIALVVAARRGLPVALHTPSEVKAAVSGSGRADKAQVAAMVDPAAPPRRPAQAGRRRRRAGAGHLPHLARRRAVPHRRGAASAGRRREDRLDDRVRQRHRRRRHPHLGRARGRRRRPGAALHARTPWPPCGSATAPRCRRAWWCARSP